MDSYFVRIYRRNENKPRMLVGVVEEIGGGRERKKSFKTFHELWNIFNPTTTDRRKIVQDKKIEKR